MARAEELPHGQIVVSLQNQTVSVAGTEWQRHFDIDQFTKHCLLNGLDDIGLTMQHEDAITQFEQQRSSLLPRTVKEEAAATA
jgi:3-isopropylmalate dehydratase small subunit